MSKLYKGDVTLSGEALAAGLATISKFEKLKRVKFPMTCPAGYSMDLYCDHYNPASGEDGVHIYAEFPHQYQGETHGEVARKARRAGWVLHKDFTATCPRCSGRKPAPVCRHRNG